MNYSMDKDESPQKVPKLYEYEEDIDLIKPSVMTAVEIPIDVDKEESNHTMPDMMTSSPEPDLSPAPKHIIIDDTQKISLQSNLPPPASVHFSLKEIQHI